MVFYKPESKKMLGIVCAVLAVMLIAACPSTPPKTPEQIAGEHLARGNQYFEKGEIEEAIAEWQKAVGVYPQHSKAHYQLGLIYKIAGDYNKEQKKIDQAIKNYERALSHYLKVAELMPNEPDIYSSIGDVFFEAEEYDRAIEQYTKALLIEPTNASYHFKLANAYGKKKDMSRQAIDHYQDAINLDPKMYDAYYNLANLYEKIGDVNNAIRYYQEYVNRESRPSEAKWVEKAKQKIYKLRGGGNIY